MAAPERPHVLIIGAGVTGILIAHGLERAGIHYNIFEAEEAGTVRSREWTMGVHWSVPMLEKLLPGNLMTSIGEACVDPSLDYLTPPTNGSLIYDGVTGGVLKELASDGKNFRVSRRKMRAHCSQGIDVKFGYQLEKVSCESKDGLVTASFANGKQYTGTILVGCDGPRSTIRDFLFGAEAAKAVPVEGIVNMATTLSYGDAERSRFDAANPEKPEDWRFFLMACFKGERGQQQDSGLSILKEKGKALAEPFRSAIEWIPNDVQMPFIDAAYWIAKPLDTIGGRVTLAGDACHPMPPYRGQGLNHAIQDAFNFVQCMVKLLENSESNQPELVQAYSDEVAKRGAQETALSKQNGYMLMSYEDAKNSPYMKVGLSKQK